MTILLKIFLGLALIGWSGLGVWMLVQHSLLFGAHLDDPAESDGARSLNLTQVWSCWIGVFVLIIYFLFQ